MSSLPRRERASDDDSFDEYSIASDPELQTEGHILEELPESSSLIPRISQYPAGVFEMVKLMRPVDLSEIAAEDLQCSICTTHYYHAVKHPGDKSTASSKPSNSDVLARGRPSHNPSPSQPFEYPVRLPCSHVFGSDCILKWLAPWAGTSHYSCPVCREPVNRDWDPNPPPRTAELGYSNPYLEFTLASEARGIQADDLEVKLCPFNVDRLAYTWPVVRRLCAQTPPIPVLLEGHEEMGIMALRGWFRSCQWGYVEEADEAGDRDGQADGAATTINAVKAIKYRVFRFEKPYDLGFGMAADETDGSYDVLPEEPWFGPEARIGTQVKGFRKGGEKIVASIFEGGKTTEQRRSNMDRLRAWLMNSSS